MGNTLRLHRGPSSMMTEGAGASLVLEEGEIFVEFPDAGLATEGSKIKIGDGISIYSLLPYLNTGGGGSDDPDEGPIMPINPEEADKKNGSIWIDDPDHNTSGTRSHIYIRTNPDPSELQNGSVYF